jgi:hypothetical protein
MRGSNYLALRVLELLEAVKYQFVVVDADGVIMECK